MPKDSKRHIELVGASSIGIAAIVGGGILVLGGIAIGKTGSGAVIAFGLNGFLAFLTVLSVAEISTLFPESGGIYTFGKRIFSIRAGFAFGWMLWFASLIAALLYALGFSAYFVAAIHQLWLGMSGPYLEWLESARAQFAVACLVVILYSFSLFRSTGGGGSYKENAVKLVVFCILISAGGYAFGTRDTVSFSRQMSPLLPFGWEGLAAAMGLSFIALQGFEVIAGVAGEIKNPERNIPRAMFLALGIALLVYIPLLLVMVVVGVPAGESVSVWCGERAHTCFADAAGNFLGRPGYWLVMVAALFSTLSALQANLLAASRLLQRMSQDRTLPRIFSQEHSRYKTPAVAILANLIFIMFFLGVVPTLDVAGSAASLVFLITYASCHGLCLVARNRSRAREGVFRTPLFPFVQLFGGICCLGIAVFQSFNEPGAGIIVLVWLILGGVLYAYLYSARAETVDAYFQALRPELVTYRGHAPLILTPITNPRTAPALVSISHALAAHGAGKVLLVKVINRLSEDSPETLKDKLRDAHEVINSAVLASISSSNRPAQALLSVSESPWREITRIAKHYRCQGLVLGVNRFDATPLESLFNIVRGDIAVLSARDDWDLSQVRRVLVPVGGKSYNDPLRARVLGTLQHSGLEEICLMSVQPTNADAHLLRDAEKKLAIRAQDEARGIGQILLAQSDQPQKTIIEKTADFDLLLLGLSRGANGKVSFGSFVTEVARDASCAVLVVGRSV